MTPLVGRKRLFFWIAMVILAVVAEIAVVSVIRRTNVARRSLYIVGVPERGAELFYGSKQCGICHSVNGSGGRIAPDLTGSRPETPAMGWLATKLWNHGPDMWRLIRRQNKPMPELNAQEMADILSFLYQASNVDLPGDATAGRAVFNEKGCVRCHSVGDTGGKSAPELSKITDSGDPNDWTRAMLNHAGSMIDPITRTLGGWPQFSGNEMNDLIAYVSDASPQSDKKARKADGSADRGWSVFQGRCIQCHSVRGKGGNIGPELGPNQDIPLTNAQFASLMWNHAPAMLRKGEESKVPPPLLQGSDMADLLSFLASLRYFEPTGSPQLGERIFAERGCATCHGTDAEGTQNGPRLKAENEAYTAVTFTAALWRHGPSMIERAKEKGIPWPQLQSDDIGEMVSFLNASAPGK
jgi:mono/diheme cytochrome c family protein